MTHVEKVSLNRPDVFRPAWCLLLAILLGLFAIGTLESRVMAQGDYDRSVAPDDSLPPGMGGRDGEAKNLPKSFLGWMFRASGIFGFLIMLVSFAMISIVTSLALQLRRDLYLPSGFIEIFEQQIQAKDYQGAYESAKASDSFIGHILAAGMGRLSRGYDEAVEQMQQVGQDETMAMDHKIGYLGLIGSIAPMLGLLGTVQGMVMSFQVLADPSSTPKPSEFADGIATALFTTLEGLVVAIPAIVFYSLFKNRLARFLMEAGFVADNLMRNFQGMKAATVAHPTMTVQSPAI